MVWFGYGCARPLAKPEWKKEESAGAQPTQPKGIFRDGQPSLNLALYMAVRERSTLTQSPGGRYIVVHLFPDMIYIHLNPTLEFKKKHYKGKSGLIQ